jgi:hypothetical protein
LVSLVSLVSLWSFGTGTGSLQAQRTKRT